MIRNLCNKCYLFDEGRILQSGATDKVVPFYLQTNITVTTEWTANDESLSTKGLPYFTLERFAFVDIDNNPLPPDIDVSVESFVSIEGTIYKPDYLLCIGFNLIDDYGNDLYLSFHTDQPVELWPKLNAGKFRIRAKVDTSFLNEGRYRIDFFSGIHCVRMLYTNEISIGFEIHGNTSRSPYWVNGRNTLLAPPLKWASF
jgi:hypothetical protein